MPPAESPSTPVGPSRNRSLMLWGTAGAALLLGYADLWRGGETVAPLLLVLAYCVLVPVAILKG